MNFHLIIIIVTCIISIIAFRSALMEKCQLNAWTIGQGKEYYRLFSYGFLHADAMHLIINMFVLWSFGGALLYYFDILFAEKGKFLFLLLYISAIPISAFYSVKKNKTNPEYNAVGASGAVSAVVYCVIFLNPYSMLRLWGIPMPSIVFGIAYLIYSYIMAKKKVDNVGHDAHFWGAIYGFLFAGIFKPQLFVSFIRLLLEPFF
ncbi:MAG: rhomboid family intramembrane serine protease [Marinilabiliaceae bacterium]|nr:rhomboid family intramembrane serine protease [Marinilabiliaceae bacterium]